MAVIVDITPSVDKVIESIKGGKPFYAGELIYYSLLGRLYMQVSETRRYEVNEPTLRLRIQDYLLSLSEEERSEDLEFISRL